MPDRVVAVMVSWNRRALVLDALAAIRSQTRPVDHVVLVDNASTDGTPDAVREAFGDIDVRVLSRNGGGAAGFAYGLDAALRLRADLVWLMDDDTVPEPGALAALLRARERVPGTALVASRAVWTDGRAHPMNTPRRRPFVGRAERTAAEAAGCVPIRSASFVSILVDAATCAVVGLPIADYFLWNDDFEFSTRLLRDHIGLLCPASVVVHRTKTFGSTDADPGDRFFYEVRNKVWLLTRSASLRPRERALYTGSTLVRWVRTLARSTDRRRLLRGLARGLWAGISRGPRRTEDVLAELS